MARKRNRPAKPTILATNQARVNECLKRSFYIIMAMGHENGACASEPESVVRALTAEKILKTVRRMRRAIHRGEELSL